MIRDVFGAQRVEVSICGKPGNVWPYGDCVNFGAVNHLMALPVRNHTNVSEYKFVYTGSFTKECVGQLIDKLVAEASKYMTAVFFSIYVPQQENLLYTHILNGKPTMWRFTSQTQETLEFPTFEAVSTEIIPTIKILSDAFGITEL